jgi:glutamine amidotransferase
MQLLASRGLEFGETPGLGWIEGDVRSSSRTTRRQGPAHGLEQPAGVATCRCWRPEGGAPVYFTHSFAIFPKTSATWRPMWTTAARSPPPSRAAMWPASSSTLRKSQAAGLRLLARFLEWRP